MFAKVEKNYFYYLPKDLIIYIYGFDSTYKTLYKQCINEMTKMFQMNRINDRILGENRVYELYSNVLCVKNSILYGENCEFSQYILRRIRNWGDQVPTDFLAFHNLTKLN